MLNDLVRSWIAVGRRPWAATFEAEGAQASVERTVITVLATTLIASIGSVIGQFFMAAGAVALGWDETADVAGQTLIALLSLVFGPFLSLLGFYIGAGVYFLIAKMLGGRGDFVLHSYLLALAYAPATLVSGLVSVVPFLIVLAGIPLLAYWAVLTTQAMKAAHGFTAGRAAAVWLIPLAVGAVLTLCALIGITALALVIVGLRGAGS
ncbi:MAG: Yip1 family protein [Chloroflexi bacterium]|nr:Yip1 family protein [Chloroflexota bacterium]